MVVLIKNLKSEKNHFARHNVRGRLSKEIWRGWIINGNNIQI